MVVFGKRFGDTHSKIYYSGDEGATWQECTKPGYRFPNTTALALNPHQRGHFWVATNGRSYARFAPGKFEQWQQEHFDDAELNSPHISAPSADADADGQTNALEFVAGLNPLDPASHFLQHILPSEGTSGSLTLRIEPRFPDRNYTVEKSTDLASNSWHPLAGFTINDLGFTRFVTDPNVIGSRNFYRVKISIP